MTRSYSRTSWSARSAKPSCRARSSRSSTSPGRAGLGVEELMDFIAPTCPLRWRRARSSRRTRRRARKSRCARTRPRRSSRRSSRPSPIRSSASWPTSGFSRARSRRTATSVVARTGNSERVAQLFRVFGRETRPVPEGIPGESSPSAKIENIQISDTLCAPAHVRRAAEDRRSRPRWSRSRSSRRRAATSRRSPAAVQKLADEDPTLRIHRDQRTGELVVTGMSQLHLDVLLHRLSGRFGVGVTTKPPRIPYKETITVPSAARLPPQEADRRPRPVRRSLVQDGAAASAAPGSNSWTPSSAARSRTSTSPPSRRACARPSSRACSPATRSRTCASSSISASTTTWIPPKPPSSSPPRCASRTPS